MPASRSFCPTTSWAENKVEITQVTSDTRESVLQNGQVDAVFATYTITDERKKLVSFAGPYYYTQQAILVLADNDDIKSVDDLADKNVAVQSGSNGPAILEEFAPKASQQEFKTDEEARQALQQGSVDAYVIDNNMQQSCLVREPGKYKIARKPLRQQGALWHRSAARFRRGVAFVNDFLKKIEDDGTWTELWQICIGDRTATPMFPSCPRSAPRRKPGNGRNETIWKRMMRFIAVNCFLTELSGLPYTREPFPYRREVRMSLSELWSLYGQNYIDALLATWGMTLESFAIAMVLAVAVTVMRVSPLKPLRVFWRPVCPGLP